MASYFKYKVAALCRDALKQDNHLLRYYVQNTHYKLIDKIFYFLHPI
jgi:hypothetical protein